MHSITNYSKVKMIQFEKEIIDFLGLPSIPRKEWDGTTPFDKGVAVLKLQDGEQAYAVCGFSNEKANVTKVFGATPFTRVEKIFVVPNYMPTVDDVKDMDLDDKSKKQAEVILREAQEIVEDNTPTEIAFSENEYIFENIHNDEEATAFIEAYNRRNHIKGRIPTSHDTIIMRLMTINAELNKKQKNGRKKNKAN